MFRIHGLCARTTHRRSSGFDSNCLDRAARPTEPDRAAPREPGEEAHEALMDGGVVDRPGSWPAAAVTMVEDPDRPVTVTVRVEEDG